METTLQSVSLNPKNPEEIFVCARSPSLYLMNLKGQVILINNSQNFLNFLNFILKFKIKYL